MLDYLKNGQGKILELLFRDAEKEYYLTEIARILGKAPGEFQVALNKLVAEGMIKDKRIGNLRFFKLNKEYPLFDEIKSIIGKTLGLEAKLKNLISRFEGIEAAFIYGSFAKGAENSASDVDLMLIGQADQDKFTAEINLLEQELKREINFQIFQSSELLEKIEAGNDFFNRIFNEPKIILKGDLNGFIKLIEQR